MGKILNDLKCKLIQKAIYAKLYKGHKPNEWEPWHEPEVKQLPSGLICHSDIKYGDNYPNSFADIWYPDDSGEKLPVVVYFHGGGFIFGNKSSGDPMQTGMPITRWRRSTGFPCRSDRRTICSVI